MESNRKRTEFKFVLSSKEIFKTLLRCFEFFSFCTVILVFHSCFKIGYVTMVCPGKLKKKLHSFNAATVHYNKFFLLSTECHFSIATLFPVRCRVWACLHHGRTRTFAELGKWLLSFDALQSAARCSSCKRISMETQAEKNQLISLKDEGD